MSRKSDSKIVKSYEQQIFHYNVENEDWIVRNFEVNKKDSDFDKSSSQ